MAKKWDVESGNDPWGGKLKTYRVQHDITGEVFGETNSHIKACEIQAENEGSIIKNQWSEELARRLFGN